MTVEQARVIDFINIDTAGDVWLTISDHLPWIGEQLEHIFILQEKLQAYLDFVESGEMTRRFPETEGRPVVLNVVCKFHPDDDATRIIELMRQVVVGAGFRLQLSVYTPH